MFADTYFQNAVRCFSRWFELVHIDPNMASDYHARGRELIATVAKITGGDEINLRIKAVCEGSLLN